MLHEQADDGLFDVRLVERHLRKEALTREQVQQHLSALPDLADGAEYLDLEEMYNSIEASRLDKRGRGQP